MPWICIPVFFSIDQLLKLRTSENSKDGETLVPVTMTPLERFVYIVGAVCLSFVIYDPYQNLASNRSGLANALFQAFTNISTILTVLPILSLLSRVTTEWNSPFSIIIALIICLTFGLDIVATFNVTEDTLYQLNISLCFFTLLVSTLFLANSIVCIYRIAIASRARSTPDINNLLATLQMSSTFTRDSAIVAHLTATFMQLAVFNIWVWHSVFNPDTVQEAISTYMYILVASFTLTFLIEFRVRKKETESAMVSM